VEDEDAHPHQRSTGLRFSEPYPRSIAHPIRLAQTRFEAQRDDDHANKKQPWHPFASQEEWELATWLIDNVNQKATDEYRQHYRFRKTMTYHSKPTISFSKQLIGCQRGQVGAVKASMLWATK
jgi:hypothetical protein